MQIGGDRDVKQVKKALKLKIAQLRMILGLEETTQVDQNALTAAEIDQLPLTANSISILNLLSAGTKPKPHIFDRYKKLPHSSSLLQGFPKENHVTSTQEIVKVIGLEPEMLFKSVKKYKVDVNKIPQFSNQFESYETFIPGAATTHTAAPITQAMNISDK